ncbi:MAG: hypothetical protein JO150_05700 [Acidobacteriaceae bacterium]|nr:hypothetical protein [Acidobacteriaceae bacterium]
MRFLSLSRLGYPLAPGVRRNTTHTPAAVILGRVVLLAREGHVSARGVSRHRRTRGLLSSLGGLYVRLYYGTILAS